MSFARHVYIYAWRQTRISSVWNRYVYCIVICPCHEYLTTTFPPVTHQLAFVITVCQLVFSSLCRYVPDDETPTVTLTVPTSKVYTSLSWLRFALSPWQVCSLSLLHILSFIVQTHTLPLSNCRNTLSR